MEIWPIVSVVLTVVGVGAFLGAGLATAAQVFFVKDNPKVSAVEEVLPGINCGACGFPGCSGYAEAVATDPDVAANLCIPGGVKVAQAIGEVTGKKSEVQQKRISLLRCTQDQCTAAPQKFEYAGIEDCAAVDAMMQGQFTCSFACLGKGSCSRSCPAEAITMKNGRPYTDPDLCTGCGICVKTCPRNVLQLAAYPGRVQVYCRNTAPPKVKRTICPSACIGCSICVRNCPYDVARMENNVAVIDHDKCPPDCPRPCYPKCPTKAILPRDEAREESPDSEF